MRVISVTPAGRRRYLAALVPHLLRQRHVIAEHHWWLNTNDASDARYVEEVTARHPDFFKICRKDVRPDLMIGENIWRFFREYCRPDTLYIRLDDDIVYLAPDAIRNLVRYRLEHRRPLLVVGNIVNNAVCTHFHQRAGLVPWRWGRVGSACMDHCGWERGAFARKLHGLFLNEIRRGRINRWKQVALPIDGTRRLSINAISWLGEDLASVPELAIDKTDEEPFLTEVLPARLNRPNESCPEALFSHFAFFPQRPHIEWVWPELVGHYQSIAEQGSTATPPAEHVRRLARDTAWHSHKLASKVRAHVRKHWLPGQAA